ncbi:MAG: hypothetical protein AB9858_04905 [Acidaminococcaceae bacterium]
MAQNGWIKLHRSVLDNPISCKDADYLAVWVYLLLNASHAEVPKNFNGEKIMLQKGQLITSTVSISKFLRVSISKVNRILVALESEQQIERLSKRHGTLITLFNWSLYQETEQPNEQVVNNQWKTNEQPVNTNKNIKNLRIKELKNNNIPKIIDDYTANENLKSALIAFRDMRMKIKAALTEYGLQLILKKLDRLSDGSDEVKIRILEQSIENSWKGIFKLKEGYGGTEGSRNADRYRLAGKNAEAVDYNEGFYITDPAELS